MVVLWFSIDFVTAPMNSRPGSTCNSWGHLKPPVKVLPRLCIYIFSKAFATLADSFDVRASAALLRLATSATVKAYLYLAPAPSAQGVVGQKRRSARCTAFGEKTSNFGRRMWRGGGKYACHSACFTNHCFAVSGVTFAALASFFTAAIPFQ